MVSQMLIFALLGLAAVSYFGLTPSRVTTALSTARASIVEKATVPPRTPPAPPPSRPDAYDQLAERHRQRTLAAARQQHADAQRLQHAAADAFRDAHDRARRLSAALEALGQNDHGRHLACYPQLVDRIAPLYGFRGLSTAENLASLANDLPDLAARADTKGLDAYAWYAQQWRARLERAEHDLELFRGDLALRAMVRPCRFTLAEVLAAREIGQRVQWGPNGTTHVLLGQPRPPAHESRLRLPSTANCDG
jgi:hypothetical protein